MNKVRTSLACVALIGTALFAGCGGGGGGSTQNPGGGGTVVPPTVTTPTGDKPVTANAPGVHLNYSAVTVPTGGQQTLTAVLNDLSGNLIAVPDANWQWSVDNAAVASITPNGHISSVLGNAVGTATVTAKETGSGQTATVVVTVIGGTGGATTGGATTGGTSGGSTTSGTTSGTPGGNTAGGPPSSLPTINGTTIYTSNFGAGVGPEWSTSNVDTTPTGRKFLGQFGTSDKTSLTLSNIPAHTTLTVGFTLFMINSVDGNETLNSYGPDLWDLNVEGGPTIVHTTFSNNSKELLAGQTGLPEGFSQSFPADYNASNPVNNSYWSGASEINNLGFLFFSKPADTVYQIVRTFPHSGSNVKLNFSSSFTQAITDESWGLEKVVVAYQ